MRTFARDRLGIPVLDSLDVERLARRFLEKTAPAVLSEPWFTPLAEIVAQLQNAGLCTFSADQDLGSTPQGYKYLGYFDIRAKHIAIDRSLTPDGTRFRFTLAHELGHFYLHQPVDLDAMRSKGGTIRDSSRDLVVHRVDASNPRSLMEWQANGFAASLLMPRETVPMALEKTQRELGMTRRLGRVWLDTQYSSWVDYRKTLSSLAALYRVSESVARYRLSDLRLVDESRSYRPSPVGATLQGALAELFSEL